MRLVLSRLTISYICIAIWTLSSLYSMAFLKSSWILFSRCFLSSLFRSLTCSRYSWELVSTSLRRSGRKRHFQWMVGAPTDWGLKHGHCLCINWLVGHWLHSWANYKHASCPSLVPRPSCACTVPEWDYTQCSCPGLSILINFHSGVRLTGISFYLYDSSLCK